MLKITSFEKSYHRDLILRIDDLTVRSGISWIKGANGAGKSTFLKAAAGIVAFDGDLGLSSGVSLKKQSVAYRKRVNFAEAEPVFPEFLTGSDLIGLFTKAKDAPKKQEDYFIESMKMGSYVSSPVGTYSSGMLKKLSLVLAFMGNPELVLLDEPLITMDGEALKTLYAWISESYIKTGTSFLLSSHQSLEDKFLPDVQELLVANQTLTYL